MGGAVQPLHMELLMFEVFEDLLDVTLLAHAGTHGWSQGHTNPITSEEPVPVLIIWLTIPLPTVYLELRADVDPNTKRLKRLISNHV